MKLTLSWLKDHLETSASLAEIVDALNKKIDAGLADATIIARLADLGALPMPMTPAEFGNLVADDTQKWAKVIRSADIKLD